MLTGIGMLVLIITQTGALPVAMTPPVPEVAEGVAILGRVPRLTLLSSTNSAVKREVLEESIRVWKELKWFRGKSSPVILKTVRAAVDHPELFESGLPLDEAVAIMLRSVFDIPDKFMKARWAIYGSLRNKKGEVNNMWPLSIGRNGQFVPSLIRGGRGDSSVGSIIQTSAVKDTIFAMKTYRRRIAVAARKGNS